MSAARWRQAMRSSSAPGSAAGRLYALPAAAADATAAIDRRPSSGGTAELFGQLQWRHLLVLAGLLLFPFVVSPFITFQIGAQALVLGLIALSLTFLGGYGGMISLAQMTVAGIAGYTVAILGINGTDEITYNWPWWLVVPCAIVVATLAATFIGWLSVRTEGIYTIMITLAIGVAFYYLVLQNYTLFNGFQGLQKVYPPIVFDINWRDPLPFYFFVLFWALAGYLAISYLVRTPFGIALQGIRDNPRRMASLGFNVVAHRVAAYSIAGIVAAVGGVLMVWYNGLIGPGSVGTSWLINILMIAILGGLRHPVGPFLGAIVFVLLQTFAIDLIDRERFNLVIGGVFLAIVLFSPDGLLGLWARLRARFSPEKPGTVGSAGAVGTTARLAGRR
jgi:branched-chain amino acid transport system permease protein